MYANFSAEKNKYEQQVARLNHEVQALKNDNNALRAARYTLSTQLEETKHINDVLSKANSDLEVRIQKLEANLPTLDMKNGLLAFLIISFVIVVITIFSFT